MITILGLSSKSETLVLILVRFLKESRVETLSENLRVGRDEGVDRFGAVFVSAGRQLGISSVRPL